VTESMFPMKTILPNHPSCKGGVLRTNCIDCKDRTNVAQYAYGLAAIGHQLHSLGIIQHPKISFFICLLYSSSLYIGMYDMFSTLCPGILEE
jgi:hypothetical protein